MVGLGDSWSPLKNAVKFQPDLTKKKKKANFFFFFFSSSWLASSANPGQ